MRDGVLVDLSIDEKKEEDSVGDSNGKLVQKSYHNVPSNPQPLLSVKRDEVITDSLLNCKPAIAKVSVPYFQVLKEGPVVYEIHASNRKCEWNVWHRFQTFRLLHEMLKDSIEERNLKCKLPVMPSAHIKLVVNHKSKDFCEGRRVLLDNYLKSLLTIKELSTSTELIGFLSHSDESLSDQKVSQEEIDQYEREKVENILVTDQNDEITSVSIPSFQIVASDYVLYAMRVYNMNKEEQYSQWTVMHRYSEFKEYDKVLREQLTVKYPHLLRDVPQLPMKEPKMIKNHFDKDFIERRRLLLDSYIKRIIKVKALRRHSLTIKFLGVREV